MGRYSPQYRVPAFIHLPPPRNPWILPQQLAAYLHIASQRLDTGIHLHGLSPLHKWFFQLPSAPPSVAVPLSCPAGDNCSATNLTFFSISAWNSMGREASCELGFRIRSHTYQPATNIISRLHSSRRGSTPEILSHLPSLFSSTNCFQAPLCNRIEVLFAVILRSAPLRRDHPPASTARACNRCLRSAKHLFRSTAPTRRALPNPMHRNPSPVVVFQNIRSSVP